MIGALGVARRVATVVVAGALVVAGAGPGAAVPPGPLGSSWQALGTSASAYLPPRLATLPDGTAMVAYLKPSGNQIGVRARPAGSSTWGPEKLIDLDPATSIAASELAINPVMVLSPSGASNFLLVWLEDAGGNRKVRAVRLSKTGVAAGTPAIVSEVGKVYLTSVAVNPAGRAAIAYILDPSPSLVFTAKLAVRSTESGAWSAPVPFNTFDATGSPSVQPVRALVAVSGSGTVCALASSGVTATTFSVVSRCGSPATVATAPQQSVGTLPNNGVLAQFGPPISVTGTTNGVLIGMIIPSADVVPLPVGTPVPPTLIRARTRSDSGGTWSTVATVGLPGELNLRPVPLSVGGGAGVSYVRIRGGLESSIASPTYAIDQRLAQQVGSGAWGPPQTLSTLAVAAGVSIAPLLGSASLGPDGQVVVPAPRGTGSGGLEARFAVRSAWTGTTTYSPLLPLAINPTSAVTASGRATVVAVRETGDVVSVSSALPKPFARSRAALSASPSVGVSVSCSSAWTDAATIARQWLVNGAVVATTSTFTPSSSQRGKALGCRVTATNPTGSTVSSSVTKVIA